MSGRGKSKELIQMSKELDRISKLTDHLICQILHHLPTKDAVRTSALSTRWRTLWLSVPRLALNHKDFSNVDALVSFGDKFFNSLRVACIDKVELNVGLNEGEDDTSYVTSWVDAAVKRKVQHLDVRGSHDPIHYFYHRTVSSFHGMPLSLYTCDTLVSLKLVEVFFPYSEFISLPCLKTIHLKGVWIPNEATFQRLVSSCPVLEELEINESLSHNVKVFRVVSKSLKKLIINEPCRGAMIDAFRLGFLSIESDLSKSFSITNVDPNVKLVINLSYSFGRFDDTNIVSNRTTFCNFLSGISKVKDLTIIGDIFSKGSLCLKWLPTILECFPNLTSLSLEYDVKYIQELLLEDMDQNNFSYVPECLLSYLEFVDFNVPVSGLAGEMNLVRYILENSAILKKLTLHLLKDCSTKDDLVKKLLKIPRGSTICEVVFVDWKGQHEFAY